MKLYKLLIAFCISVSLFSCSKNDATNDGVTVTEKTFLNVAYGNDAKQKMDIYLPKGRSEDSTKVMVLIHGGAWAGGDKQDFDGYLDSLKKLLPDYALFNVNYRLSAGDTINKFPTQEIDIRTVVNHIYAKASDYQVSKKIVLLGASAGGHLAMLQGFKDTVPVRVKAIVSFYGPSDLLDMYNNPVGGNVALRVLLGATIGKTPMQDMPIYINSSPVNFIKSTSPPTILFHGGADALVAPSQSVAVKNLLTTAGVTNDYIFYPTAGHGGWSAATEADAFSKMKAFLVANVR